MAAYGSGSAAYRSWAPCDAPVRCVYAVMGLATKARTLLVPRCCCNLRWWVTARVRTEERAWRRGTLLRGAPPR